MHEMTEDDPFLPQEQYEAFVRAWLTEHELLESWDPIEVALIVHSVPLLCPRCLRTLSYDLVCHTGSVVWPGDTVTDVLGPDPRGTRADRDLADAPLLRDDFDTLTAELGAGMGTPRLLIVENVEGSCGRCAATMSHDYAIVYDGETGRCVLKAEPTPVAMLRENRTARIRAGLGWAPAVVPEEGRLAHPVASGHGTVREPVPAATLAVPTFRGYGTVVQGAPPATLTPPRIAATARVLDRGDR